MQPRAGTDQLVMTRPRIPCASWQVPAAGFESSAVGARGWLWPPTPAASSEAAGARAGAKPCESKCRAIQGSLDRSFRRSACRRIGSEAPGGKGRAQLLLAKADVGAVSRQLELALLYDGKLDVAN